MTDIEAEEYAAKFGMTVEQVRQLAAATFEVPWAWYRERGYPVPSVAARARAYMRGEK